MLLQPIALVQRTTVTALALLPAVLITVAVLPACLLLPFFPSRCRHVEELVNQLACWTSTLLVGSCLSLRR